MAAITRSISLPDGRAADVLLGGDPEGIALVMHHGSPSDATTFAEWHDACLARGMRLICMSRPGYATSTRLPGRIVAQAAADTLALLDHLDADTFVTAGWSGGGPHALACAALLNPRCLKAATLAGVGPYGAAGLDFLAGMGPENVEEFGAALEGEAAIRAWMSANGESFRHVTGPQIVEAFGGLVPPVDRDVLVGGYAEEMATEVRRALEHGFDGWADDDLAFTQPWGFNVADLQVPVTVWQGDLDLMVPAGHGAWLAAHIPTARTVIAPGHGHISLVTRFRDTILDDLLAYE